MKFIHVGDLHLGKMLHNVAMVQEDQPFWVERLLEAVDEQQADALVIAGDVYDRRVPPTEAMQLFDHLLTEMARRDKAVLVVPGNHDSAVRLGHVNSLLTDHQIYIAGELRRDLPHVTIKGVTFWLMPYVFPKAAADDRVLGEDVGTYDEAVRRLLAEQAMDPSAVNVLVAHQNVLANGCSPEHSDSETLIGGLGEIDVSAFDPFDYVALGHIHNAQKIGRETVRYSGCPLYYDFSEINRKKALTVVTIRSKEDILVEQIDIPLRHHLLEKRGELKELLEQGLEITDKDSYYIQCILENRHVPSRALEQLREVYGDSLIHVKREVPDTAEGTAVKPGESRSMKTLSVEEQFGQFYQELQDELLDDRQEQLLGLILEQQSRRAGDYYTLDGGNVPEKDSEELLDFLMREPEPENDEKNRMEDDESAKLTENNSQDIENTDRDAEDNEAGYEKGGDQK